MQKMNFHFSIYFFTIFVELIVILKLDFELILVDLIILNSYIQIIIKVQNSIVLFTFVKFNQYDKY